MPRELVEPGIGQRIITGLAVTEVTNTAIGWVQETSRIITAFNVGAVAGRYPAFNPPVPPDLVGGLAMTTRSRSRQQTSDVAYKTQKPDGRRPYEIDLRLVVWEPLIPWQADMIGEFLKRHSIKRFRYGILGEPEDRYWVVGSWSRSEPDVGYDRIEATLLERDEP